MTSGAGKRIVLHCDAGPHRGIGHVMRCIALAEEFAARGATPVFVADVADVPWAARQLAVRGYAVHERAEGTSGLAGFLLSLAPDAVVHDSYVTPPEVTAAVRAAGVPVVAITDGVGFGSSAVADLYVDQNLGAEDDPWPSSSGRRMAGLRYVLHRDEIREARPRRPRIDVAGGVPEVLAHFGGTDPAGAAPVLAGALAATGLPFAATVIAARPELAAAISAVPLRDGQRITVTGPFTGLPDRAARADLVLCACGTSVWEMLCVGAAAAITVVAENQQVAYPRVAATGAVAGLGPIGAIRDDPTAAVASLTRLLSNPGERAALRAVGWSLVDGRGRERVADALMAVMLKPPR